MHGCINLHCLTIDGKPVDPVLFELQRRIGATGQRRLGECLDTDLAIAIRYSAVGRLDFDLKAILDRHLVLLPARPSAARDYGIRIDYAPERDNRFSIYGLIRDSAAITSRMALIGWLTNIV